MFLYILFSKVHAATFSYGLTLIQSGEMGPKDVMKYENTIYVSIQKQTSVFEGCLPLSHCHFYHSERLCPRCPIIRKRKRVLCTF